jgi:hypothetical protein
MVLPQFSKSELMAQVPSCNNLPSFDFTFNNQQVAGQVFTNKAIRITGTVTFSSNVTMRGCTVLMDNDAVIQLRQNVTFAASSFNGVQTKFFGCGNMWKSININSTNTIRFSNCLIQDGKEGIKLFKDYKAGLSFIQRCTFTRNQASISATDVPVFTFGDFSGNQFIGDAPNMLPPFANGQPIGANINRCVGSLGTVGTVNTYNNLNIGVSVVNNSTLSVNNSNFTFNRGLGIEANNSVLNILGSFTGARSCTFTRNRTDIQSAMTRGLFVSKALFTDPIVSSIRVINSQTAVICSIDIRDCSFLLSNNNLLPTNNLIDIQRTAQGGGGVNTYITYDTITVQPAIFPSPNNIRLINFTTAATGSPTDQASILSNLIQCDFGNPTMGGNTSTIDGMVFTGNADSYRISDNRLFYDVPTQRPTSNISTIGIGMLNNSGLFQNINRNTLLGRYFAGGATLTRDHLRCAVHIINTPNLTVCSNNSNNITNNYHFSGNCGGLEFGANTIGNGDFGLVTGNGGGATTIPQTHPHRRNQWTGTYSLNSASHISGTQNLDWLVDPASNPVFLPPPVTIPGNWFRTEAEPATWQNPCQSMNAAEPPTRELTLNFLNGVYGFPNTTAIADFETNLLYQIIRYPAAIASNTAATQYYTNRVGSTIWKLAKGRRMLDEVYLNTDQNQLNLDLLQTTSQNLSRQVLVIDQSGSATTDSLLQEQKRLLLEQLDQNRQDMEVLNTAIQISRKPLLDAAFDYINNISVSNDWETQRKTLLLLVAKACTSQVWDINDNTNLRSIANLCPTVYGDIVVMAREMLPNNETNVFPHEGDDPACGSRENHEPHEEIHQNEVKLSIFPNPTNDMLNVQFSVPFTGSVEIYDISGVVITTKNYTDTSTVVFGTSTFPSGIYTLRCTPNGGQSQMHRLVVTH